MITYTGSGSNQNIQIALIGDDSSKQITIDLKKAPFLLSFPFSNFPVNLALLIESGPTPIVKIAPQGSLDISYSEPLKSAEPNTSGMTPRSQFRVWLLYSA